MDKITDFKIGLETLEGTLRGTSEELVNLGDFVFEYDDSGEPTIKSSKRKFFFDMKRPWAMKQLLAMTPVSLSLFEKNPPYLNKELMDCWLPEIEKKNVLIKLRTGKKSKTYARAVLPQTYVSFNNAEIFNCIDEVVGDDYELQLFEGFGLDDPIFHTRVLLPDEFLANGDKCRLGLMVVSSELGACPLEVNSLLFTEKCSNGAIATYNKSSYFKYNYRGMQVQKDDLLSMFHRMIGRIQDDFEVFKKRAKEIAGERLTKEELIKFAKEIKDRRHMFGRVGTKVVREVIEKAGEMNSKWDVISLLTVEAQNQPLKNRVFIEQVAGELLGLNFKQAA